MVTLNLTGLNGAVMGVLANATYTTDGAYGTPTYYTGPDALEGIAALAAALRPLLSAGAFWNTVGGALTKGVGVIESGLEGLAAIAWSAARAADIFVTQIGAALHRFAVDLVQATVGALKAVGEALEKALAALAAYLLKLAEAALSAAWQVVLNGAVSYVEGVVVAFHSLFSSILAYSNGTVGLSAIVASTIGFAASLIGLASFANSIRDITQVVSAALTPVERYLDIGALIAGVANAVGLSSVLGGITGALDSLESAAGSAIGGAFGHLTSDLLGSSPVTTPGNVPGWLPSASVIPNLLVGRPSSSFFESLVTAFGNAIPVHTGYDVVDVVFTVVSTALWIVYWQTVYNPASPLGGLADEFEAILLTVVAWVCILAAIALTERGATGLPIAIVDLLALATAADSVVLDTEAIIDFQASSEPNEYLFIAAVVDLLADGAGGAASMIGLSSAF